MRQLFLASALAVSLSAGSIVYAGLGHLYPVAIYGSASGGSAAGSFQGAHLSADKTNYISCSTAQFTNLSGVSVLNVGCTATANGVTRSCVSYSPSLMTVAALTSINPSSYVYFQYDARGNCTYISVTNQSIDDL